MTDDKDKKKAYGLPTPPRLAVRVHLIQLGDQKIPEKRRHMYARLVRNGSSCEGCEKCMCQIDHDGKKCGKKLANVIEASSGLVVELDPHVDPKFDDAHLLRDECERLGRSLTIQESTWFLTGGEAA